MSSPTVLLFLLLFLRVVYPLYDLFAHEVHQKRFRFQQIQQVLVVKYRNRLRNRLNQS